MDSTHDESSLYEVDEDEFAATSGWDNSPLTTTMSNPVSAEQVNKPGSSSSRASQQSPKKQHQSMLVRSKATHFLPLQAAPGMEESEADIALDTYGEEQIAAGTQRAAEHAQATLANAAAQRYERAGEQGQTSRFFGGASPSQQRLNQANPSPFIPSSGITSDGLLPQEAFHAGGERTSLLELSKRKCSLLLSSCTPDESEDSHDPVRPIQAGKLPQRRHERVPVRGKRRPVCFETSQRAFLMTPPAPIVTSSSPSQHPL